MFLTKTRIHIQKSEILVAYLLIDLCNRLIIFSVHIQNVQESFVHMIVALKSSLQLVLKWFSLKIMVDKWGTVDCRGVII